MAHDQLPIPPLAEQDAGARELLRVWAAGGKQHVSLAAGLWRDPAAWGVVLADLSRHLARAHAQTAQMPEREVLERIREALEAEWGYPTDEPNGGLLR